MAPNELQEQMNNFLIMDGLQQGRDELLVHQRTVNIDAHQRFLVDLFDLMRKEENSRLEATHPDHRMDVRWITMCIDEAALD